MFRHGQWVKFRLEVPKAHVTADGLTVGIYQKAGKDPLTEVAMPACVVAVKQNGNNVRLLNDEGDLVLASFDPAMLPDLQPLLDKADLPPGRVMAPDFKLRP